MQSIVSNGVRSQESRLDRSRRIIMIHITTICNMHHVVIVDAVNHDGTAHRRLGVPFISEFAAWIVSGFRTRMQDPKDHGWISPSGYTVHFRTPYRRIHYTIATSECHYQGLGDVSGPGGAGIAGTGSWKLEFW